MTGESDREVSFDEPHSAQMRKPVIDQLRKRIMERHMHDADRCLSAEDLARLKAVNLSWNDDIVANRKVVLEIYSPLARAGNKSGIAVTRDLRYGPDGRQMLDVFVPADAKDAPVVIFVHGGAFTRGSKSVDGEIYDNFLYWFANQGCVGINVEYRLAPHSTFPGGAQDIALAVSWVTENVAKFGGNPANVILIGHSAGGAHVASYLTDPNIGLTPHSAVIAAVLISARLRLECRNDNPNARNVAAYCGTDQTKLAQYSAVTYADRFRWPLFVAFAEFENRHLDTYALEFASKVSEARKKAPRVMQVTGHNHTSIVAHFNTGEETLGPAILSFIKPLLKTAH